MASTTINNSCKSNDKTNWIELSSEQLNSIQSQILFLLKSRCTDSSSMFYNIISMYLSNRNTSKAQVTIYLYNNLPQRLNNKDKILLLSPDDVIILRLKRNSISKPCYLISTPLTISHQLLEQLISDLNSILDWTEPIKFVSFDPIWVPKLLELCQSHGIIQVVTNCNQYILKAEAADENHEQICSHDNGLVLKSLSPYTDAQLLTDNWVYSKYEDGNALGMIQDCISSSPSVGLYKGDELIAWILLKPTGDIGMLQTQTEYQGHGYGKLVIDSMLNKVSRLGLIPVLEAEVNNSKANSFLLKSVERAGFRLITSRKTVWINYRPT